MVRDSVLAVVTAVEGQEARKDVDVAWARRLWVDGQCCSSARGFFGVGPWGLVGGGVWLLMRAGCCWELIRLWERLRLLGGPPGLCLASAWDCTGLYKAGRGKHRTHYFTITTLININILN